MPAESATSYEHPMTISELLKFCAFPADCNSVLECEGDMVWVQGMLDAANIFDARRYPQLNTEKFKLTDSHSGAIVEVFVSAGGSRDIFDRIYQAQRESQSVMVTVRGRIQGFDMPTMGSCRKGVSLLVDNCGEVRVN